MTCMVQCRHWNQSEPLFFRILSFNLCSIHNNVVFQHFCWIVLLALFETSMKVMWLCFYLGHVFISVSRSSCSVLLWNHLNLRGQVLVHCQYFRGLWECDMYLVFTGIWMINIHVHVNKISYYVDDRCKLVGERNHKYQWFYSIIL